MLLWFAKLENDDIRGFMTKRETISRQEDCGGNRSCTKVASSVA
jgi:hypothetical protein